jgi:hypothetical protein
LLLKRAIAMASTSMLSALGEREEPERHNCIQKETKIVCAR